MNPFEFTEQYEAQISLCEYAAYGEDDVPSVEVENNTEVVF